MVVVITRFCNTDSCTYCHVHTRDFGYNAFDVLEKDAVFVEKMSALAASSGDFAIRFFGGEPLLRVEKIKDTVRSLAASDSRFEFAVNTNLLLADAEFFDFCGAFGITLIVSCNGDPFSHSLSRGIDLKKTDVLYSKIREIVRRGIPLQVNMVFQPETADRFVKNLRYLRSLGISNVNLLPASYVEGWKPRHVEVLSAQFAEALEAVRSRELPLTFENLRSSDAVHLFKSELVVDSDGAVYPNMVALEDFFLERREKIRIANLADSPEELSRAVAFYFGENREVYDEFVNRFLSERFAPTLPQEIPVREAFDVLFRGLWEIPWAHPK